jgi:hypothetical protein
MVERVVFWIIGGTFLLSMLAAVLPKIIPAATFIFVFVVIGRVVWWYTR